RVGIARHIDGRYRVAERVGDIERASIGAQGQVAWVRAVEVVSAGRNFGDLGEEGAGVHAGGAYLILEAVAYVEARSVPVENGLLGIEAGLKLAYDCIRCSINDTGKVAVLVEHDHVGVRVDRRVDGRALDAGRARAACLPDGAQIEPAAHALQARIHDRDPPVRIALPTGKRHEQLLPVRCERQGVGPGTERLVAVRPELAAALDDGVVWVYARAGIGSSVEVTGSKHNLGVALHPAALPGRLCAHDLLDRIACRAGDDAALGVGL